MILPLPSLGNLQLHAKLDVLRWSRNARLDGPHFLLAS